MNKLIALGLACAAATLPACRGNAPFIPVPERPVLSITGAEVFDGSEFIPGRLCVAAAIFITCPEQADQTLDLSGQFITPPFGDAHTHHFDSPYTLDWHTQLNLSAGVLYAMTMTAPTTGVNRIRDQLSGPRRVDVATSLGGMTGPESHPAEIYEALALGIRSYEEQAARQDDIRASRKSVDNAYFVVETARDIDAKMDLLLGTHPDHVKVYLRSSERFDEGWGKWGPGGGINPDFLPAIAARTHAAGLRLAVSASSLADFQTALKAGADIITHLPCYQDTESDPDGLYYDVDSAGECVLSFADAAAAAELGTISTLITSEWDKDRPQKRVDWEQENIRKLQSAGAVLVVGSNAYGSAINSGMIAAAEKSFLSPAELLRLASQDTPQAIFPNRKIGCLDPGCEASFIAFSSNPLDDFSVIGNPYFLFKDGQVLTLRKDN